MKISLATLLIVAIWIPSLAVIPALIMAVLMICAQLAHLKVKNPLQKFVPSALLLFLSIFVAVYHLGYFA